MTIPGCIEELIIENKRAQLAAKVDQAAITVALRERDEAREELKRVTEKYLKDEEMVNVVDWRSRCFTAEHRVEELTEALRKAHDAMQSWFSSEYLSHPISREVGAALARAEGKP